MQTKDLFSVLLLMFFLLLVGCGGGVEQALGGTISLAWDSNTDPDVVPGYKMYCGTASGTYDHQLMWEM